jgi:hypothetical protein
MLSKSASSLHIKLKIFDSLVVFLCLDFPEPPEEFIIFNSDAVEVKRHSNTLRSTYENNESQPISTPEGGNALSPSTVSQSPTSQPRSPSETNEGQEDHMDADTESESVSTSSENDMSDSEDEEGDFRCAMNLLDSHLMTIFQHDLPFVARLIPQVHECVYALLAGKNVGDFKTFLWKSGIKQHMLGCQGTSGPSNSSAPNSLAANSSSSSSSRKRARNPERSNGGTWDKSGTGSNPDPEGDPDPVDGDHGSEEDGQPRPKFACHFHKHDARRYGPWADRKYRLCPCLNIPVLRRIKYVFLQQN